MLPHEAVCDGRPPAWNPSHFSWQRYRAIPRSRAEILRSPPSGTGMRVSICLRIASSCASAAPCPASLLHDPERRACSLRRQYSTLPRDNTALGTACREAPRCRHRSDLRCRCPGRDQCHGAGPGLSGYPETEACRHRILRDRGSSHARSRRRARPAAEAATKTPEARLPPCPNAPSCRDGAAGGLEQNPGGLRRSCTTGSLIVCSNQVFNT